MALEQARDRGTVIHKAIGDFTATFADGLPADPQSEAVIALQQLGYKPAEAVRMAREAAESGDDAATIIRKALKSALR